MKPAAALLLVFLAPPVASAQLPDTGQSDEGLRQAKGKEARMRGRRPGWPFHAVGRRGSDGRFAFAVTVLFTPADQFTGAHVRYRETLTLPEKPAVWPEPDEQLPEPVRQKNSISADGRTFTTHQTTYLKAEQGIPTYVDGDGLFILSRFPTHEFTVVESDPLGKWKVEAYINDELVLREEFEVVEGNAIRFKKTAVTSPTPMPSADP